MSLKKLSGIMLSFVSIRFFSSEIWAFLSSSAAESRAEAPSAPEMTRLHPVSTLSLSAHSLTLTISPPLHHVRRPPHHPLPPT